MKVLVIGSGRMGAIRAEDLSANSKVSQVLITNRNPDHGIALAQKFSAEFVPWDLLGSIEADAFVVAVGTAAHEQVLSKVLPHGKPVLCEKPIAASLSGTRAAIESAAKYGATLQIGFQRRFDENIQKMKQQIQSGEIGTLYSLTMTAHDFTPSAREFIEGSGGIFRDMHVHDFDLIRWLTDTEVETVFATKSVLEHQDYADFGDADTSAVVAKTSSGVPVIISGTRHNGLGQDVRLEAFGSKNSISAGLNTRTPLHDLEQQLKLNVNPYLGFVDRFRDAFRNETNAFVSFAGGEIANPCPADSALESLRIAEACELSAASGKSVHVAEVL